MRFINLYFPVIALIMGFLAYKQPSYFVSFKPSIPFLLAIVMLGMGLTLSANDFLRVLKRPLVIALGSFLQFGIMPLAAFLIASLLALPQDLVIGMVLLGAAPGGTASNVICYLAKADVALSISMTLVSTLLSLILMPALTWLYLHQQVEVDALKMLSNILLIVVVPIVLGIFLNRIANKQLQLVQQIFPVVSMLAIALIVAIIIALNRDSLASVGWIVITAIVLHNAIGLTIAYSIARLMGYETAVRRTLAIEVGMQNSGLAATLAGLHFSSYKLAALPSVLFSIWHNISGIILAMLWRLKSEVKIK